MKNLVIVESPSKSKTIEKYLGNDYMVVSSKGHIRDLATTGKGGLGIDVEHDFEPTYKISADKRSVVKELKDLAKKSDHIYLASDPDREGEAIAWHLAQVLGLDVNDENRIVFNEITKGAVTEALKHPRTIDIPMVKSQETRRMLDRIIGFKLSKLLQSKIKSKSAGRVQSVALRLIVEREQEIRAFKSEEYWTLAALVDKDSKKFNANLIRIGGKKAELKTQQEVDAIISRCHEFKVSSIEKKVRKKEPRMPFITSTLQQEASTKLGFGAKKTMQIAQKLYEGIALQGGNAEGLISYMRTDSTRLSEQFVRCLLYTSLRRTIRQALSQATSFDEFSSLLLREGVTVKESRGRLSYLTPDRTKPITARKLGDDFDKAAVLALLTQNARRAAEQTKAIPEYPVAVKKPSQGEKPTKTTPADNTLQRMVDREAKRAEGKGVGYDRWAAKHNLNQMAATVTAYQQYGFSSPEELDEACSAAYAAMQESLTELKQVEKTLNTF